MLAVSAFLAAGACSQDTENTGADGGIATADGGVGQPDARTATTDASAATVDYGQDGQVDFTVDSQHVSSGGRSFDVTAYLPSSAGAHPAVVLSCGTNQSAAGYAPYGRRLASHGIAMVIVDDPGVLVNTTVVAGNAEYVVETWLASEYAGIIDTSNIGLAGHSRGGGASLLAAEHLDDQVQAWFGLDPVDNEFLMAPGEYARYNLPDIGIPTGFLGAEVVSNCAPAADGYSMLFPLAPSPSVLVVALGAGHTQVEDLDNCTDCAVCSPSGTADSDVVLAYSVRYFTAFFARELLGDTSVGAHFEGAGGPEDVAAGLVTIE